MPESKLPHRRPGKVRIGISGWNYPPWRGVFYPPGLPHARELDFAASRFRSIEINGTFYSLQRPEYFADWAARTPADFVFSVKAPRYITHMLKLRNAEVPLANFLASGLLLWGRSSGRCCGSSRRTSRSTRNGSSRSCAPCRTTPIRRRSGARP